MEPSHQTNATMANLLNEHNKRFDTIDKSFETLDERIEDDKQAVLKYIIAEGEKTRRHFDVVAEELFERLNGAQQDKISLHQ